MTIDEAIEVYEHPTQHFSSEHREADKKAIQSMKELKLLRAELKSHILYDKELTETKMFQLGYNKAANDFAEKFQIEISESLIWGMIADSYSNKNTIDEASEKIVDYVIETSKKVAEKLKAGERMPKGIPPKQKECRCWLSYPNSNFKERCSYYYCIKPMCLESGKRRTKTVCRLKECESE